MTRVLCRKSLLAGWLILIAATTFLRAQDFKSVGAKLPDAQRAQLEDAISKFMAANHVTGLSAAVVKNGEFAWSGGFGMADVENYVPATSQTLYRMASVSKPLTATGALLLWQQGKLDLDAPIQKYCPAFPQKTWPITTRQLLAHLSGIRHYHAESDNDAEVDNTRHFDSIQSGMTFFKDDPLLSQPGTKFHYTTHGYTVVGCVIEGASGKSYIDFMHNNVFVPAGMTSTQQDNLLEIIPKRSRGYSKNEAGAVENAGLLDSSYKVPGGGLLSSAEDMARFEAAILNDKLVQRSTRDAMWTPQKLADGAVSDYALGWGMRKWDSGGVDAGKGPAIVSHSGSQQGTSSSIMLAPDLRDGVVVLINMDELDASALAQSLLKIVLPADAH